MHCTKPPRITQYQSPATIYIKNLDQISFPNTVKTFAVTTHLFRGITKHQEKSNVWHLQFYETFQMVLCDGSVPCRPMLLFNIPDLVQRPIATAVAGVNLAARWRYRPSIKNLTAHYNSQFWVSFHFCFYQEAQKRLQTCLNWA